MNNDIFYAESELHLNSNIEAIRKIYSRIEDDVSKEIFMLRLAISVTEDNRYVRKLCGMSSYSNKLRQELLRFDKVYIYGAGIRGKKIKLLYPEINYIAYVDKEKRGQLENLPIVVPEEVKVDKNTAILVSVKAGYIELVEYIKEKFKTENVIAISAYEDEAYTEQYFEKRCIDDIIPKQGVFIDGGAYDGNDSIRFIKSSLYNENEIHIFEPDTINLELCKTKLQGMRQITYHQNCLGEDEGMVSFEMGNGQLGKVTQSTGTIVKVQALDELFGKKRVAYIKLDVEGCEIDVLKGTEKIIREQHPVLMLSIYHKEDDIVAIPELLLSFYSKYKFKLGHYGIAGAYDTVLYAYE